MGAAMGNPVSDETRKELTDTMTKILETFTTNYIKAYKTLLIAKVIDDIKNPSQPTRLLDHPPDNDPIRTGYLVKRGEIRQNWLKRFFVVRPDYTVEYYENEDKFKANAKPKGTMVLGGYTVNTDPNMNFIERLKKVMKQLGVEEEIPSSEKFPKFTLEMYHESRRNWYVQCANEEEFNSWAEEFKTICRRNWGRKRDDSVAFEAFDIAIRETRWALGRWGWWSYGGTEEDILADLVLDQLQDIIVSKVFCNITGAYKIRMMVRDKVYEALKTSIGAAVSGSWKAISGSIASLRPTIEDGLKKAIDPVVQAQNDLVEKIKEKVMDKVEPVLKEVVAPVLGKIVDLSAAPIFDGYKETIKVFVADIDEYAKTAGASIGDLKPVMKPMYYHARSFWSLWNAYSAVRKLYEPLSLLGEIIQHVDAWDLIDAIERSYNAILEKAYYTFEDDIRNQTAANPSIAPPEAIAGARSRTLEKYQGDVLDAVQEQIVNIMSAILLPPVEQKVTEPCSAVLQPIEDLIPSPVKDFVSVQAMFSDLVEGLVTDSITSVVEPTIEKLKEAF